jgi:large subunit ribosomal protein L25
MEATLQAVKRETRGKNEARRLRVSGQIPAVVYGGKGKESQAIAVDPKSLLRILRSDSGFNTLIALSVDGGESTRVLVKAHLLDPVHHKLLHADFYRIAMDQMLTVKVPVILKGEAKGAKLQGGLVDFVHREVEIECLPADIPEHLEVDITDLQINQGVRLRDLAAGVKWRAVSDPDTLLVHVVSPKAEVAEVTETAPTAGSEPEVIKKGKTEKEEEK